MQTTVVMMCYYAILCRPFEQYWAVPVDNPQCATYASYSKIQMAFNISSDVFIILMPTTIIARTQLPRKRKIILCILFSLGIFTIVCAILNKYYNFASPMTTIYQLWYIREASVMMWVGNLVCCWQLVQFVFKTRSFDDKHDQLRVDGSPLADEEGGPVTHKSGWFRRKIDQVPDLSISMGGVLTEHEKPGTGDHSSLGGTTLQEDKKCSTRIQSGTMMSLISRDDKSDATYAVKYRRDNDIL